MIASALLYHRPTKLMFKQLLVTTAIAVAFCTATGKANAASPTPQPTPVKTPEPTPFPTPHTAPVKTSQPIPVNKKETSEFRKHLPRSFVIPTDPVGLRLLKDYGSMYVAKGVTVPNTVAFADEAEVTAFQLKAGSEKATIGQSLVELQPRALHALKEAIEDASKLGLDITPRSADSSKRTYKHTVDLWASRVNPGLAHWMAAGRIKAADAARIKSLLPFQQVPEIFALEEKGIWFAKDLSKSIVYSVAPPGTSQHLSMLALDVTQFEDARVRTILAKNGWFQTVTSDLPHFTYLGEKESDLPKLGLKKVTYAGRDFWVPDI